MPWKKEHWEIAHQQAIQEAKGYEEQAKEMEEEGHHEIASHLRENRDDWFRIAQLLSRLT